MKSLLWLTDPEHGACPEVWLIYSVTLYWEKPIFLFPNSYQLQIPSCLGVYFPFSVLGFCLI